MSKDLKEIVKYLESKLPFKPEVGIILGSGLGSLGDEIESPTRIDYHDIPNFPQSTVEGHAGELIAGSFGGKKVIAFKGRFHYYEGYSMEQVVTPVRVLALLGAKYLFVSNACGGVNPAQEIGELMIIRDHINLFPDNPLLGPNNDNWGPRFPDMSQAYDKDMIAAGEKAAKELGIKVSKGVYAGLTGPCLETPAEYKYIRIIGADAVGMSTVPEVIASHHMGMRNFGISVITDLGVEGKIVKTTHEDVVAAANKAASQMVPLLKRTLELI